MKQKYIAPMVKTIEFEATDIICTSGDSNPVAQTLYTNEGAELTSKSMVDLVNQ